MSDQETKTDAEHERRVREWESDMLNMPLGPNGDVTRANLRARGLRLMRSRPQTADGDLVERAKRWVTAEPLALYSAAFEIVRDLAKCESRPAAVQVPEDLHRAIYGALHFGTLKSGDEKPSQGRVHLSIGAEDWGRFVLVACEHGLNHMANANLTAPEQVVARELVTDDPAPIDKAKAVESAAGQRQRDPGTEDPLGRAICHARESMRRAKPGANQGWASQASTRMALQELVPDSTGGLFADDEQIDAIACLVETLLPQAPKAEQNNGGAKR